MSTQLPLKINIGARIALVGNTLLERAQRFGHFETMLQTRFPTHQLVIRNLAWPADAVGLQPRPDNFADTDQHLTHEKADVILVAFGFNESFAGADGLAKFKQQLAGQVHGLCRKAFNGETGPQIVLLSPIPCENLPHIPAADENNARLKLYADVVQQVAREQHVGYVDVFDAVHEALEPADTHLTINGVHLTEEGYRIFANRLFEAVFAEPPPMVDERIRKLVQDKNRQYRRRFRPLNTFYYTGGRNKSYGYLDFLPAMQNFEILVNNREQRIWDLARGHTRSTQIDDRNLPPLPDTKQSRGANRWMTAEQERATFRVDPRFEVNLFAGEEDFPDIAAPIQMRWDAHGRLWVSCSTTYPHVYPGHEPNDKLVVLEDTDGDGRADNSTVFADDLHIPLSFEFGNGGVYVSEMPDLTFLKDTDGDGKADFRRQLLTGFGTEDSHHALHDFTWTPDGDLIFREGIFHHSQIETAYGPVRQQNSGWYRFRPQTQRLLGFGTYHSTNPWGVTFDDWGQHVASHPIFASAFHALDPAYPRQHPRPAGLQAYSGTCGQEFVDFATFPDSMQGQFLKVRYKPTNRVEIHDWVEHPFGYEEAYRGDLLFSSNLSFIPVDIRFGPRGALYVCDWYNPIKGHAQYSLRDERRDRHAGRIWRITAKGRPLQLPPKIAGASIAHLLDVLTRPEYRYRYWAKRALREKNAHDVSTELDQWVKKLDATDPRFRHHQLEALWTARWIGATRLDLLRELISCDVHHARAAATRQLRYVHAEMPDAEQLLRRSARDAHGLVRLEAVIAASYVGTQSAFESVLEALQFPHEKHLDYAIRCALGSRSLRPYWERNPKYGVARLLNQAKLRNELKEPPASASQAAFDVRANLKRLEIACMPERMLYTLRQFVVQPGQPVKVVFKNSDATDHNLVLVRPGALSEVGMAANEMAKDPRNASSDFIPESKRHLILHASPMIGPTRKARIHVLRFEAPVQPGIYPYVCTFPGHWVVMKGQMIVARNDEAAAALLAEQMPEVVREWSLRDFESLETSRSEPAIMRGMQAFAKARCGQCHVVDGHGVELGPELTDVAKRFTGKKLLRQILEPSHEIAEKYQIHQFLLDDGRAVSGVIKAEDEQSVQVLENLLVPQNVTKIPQEHVEERLVSKVSAMPVGLVDVLTREELVDLVSFLEAGGYPIPNHLKHSHAHSE